MRKAQRQAKQDGGASAPAAGDNPERQRTPEQTAERQRLREVVGQWVQSKVVRDVYSERQLDAVLGDFWFNHFNVDMTKNVIRFTAQDYQRSAIDPNVLGNFRALLGATAHHPAMMVYLDNERSTRAANMPGLADDNDRRGGGNFSVGVGGGAFFGGRRGGGAGASSFFTPRRRNHGGGEAEKKFTQCDSAISSNYFAKNKMWRFA
jgi:uncharacterized protein (DUF1800 family)